MTVVTLDVTPIGTDDLRARILTTVQRLQAEGYTVNSATIEGDEANLADLKVQDELSPQRIVDHTQLEAQEMRGITPEPVPEPEDDDDEEADDEPHPAQLPA